MGDILKIYEWLVENPGYSWIPLLLTCALTILLYESVKSLLPKLLEHIANRFWTSRSEAKERLKVEEAMRSLCLASCDRNWACALPVIAKHNLNLPLSEVFVLPPVETVGAGELGHSQEIGEILEIHRTLCVTGPPGAGKSSLLSSLAIAFAKEDTTVEFGIVESRVPVFLEFKEFVEVVEEMSLELAMSHVLSRKGVKLSEDHAKSLLSKGRCAIFLDGLDEAGDPPKRRKTLSWLVDCLAAFPSANNRLVVSCRDFEWENAATPGIARAIIQPFDTNHAKAFVEKYEVALEARSNLKLTDHRRHKFASFVDNIDHDYQFMASNPMLLTLAVALLTVEGSIPTKRSDVVAGFVRTMLLDWGEINRRRDTKRQLEETLAKLERLAFCALDRPNDHGTIYLGDEFASKTISEDGEAATIWLESVASSSGLLTQISEGCWTFSNRRILEFLAANELARLPDLWSYFSNRPEWREVFGFLPELVKDGSQYLNWLEELGEVHDELHASLVISAAITLSNTHSAASRRLTESASRFLMSGDFHPEKSDPNTLREFLQLTWSDHRILIGQELEALKFPVPEMKLVKLALYSNWSAVAEYIAERIPTKGRSHLGWLTDMLPNLVPSMRVPLLHAIMRSSMSAYPVDEGMRSIVACGREALDKLIEMANDAQLRGKREERLLRTIAAFRNRSATTFLLEQLAAGRVSDALLTENVRNLVSDSSGKFENLPEISNATFYKNHGKRLLDLSLSAVVLVLLMPLMVLVALAIKMEGPEAIIFVSRKVGKNGAEFHQYKFRTMRVVSPELQQESWSHYDPRITRIGSFLRKTGIDEIPSIWNVFRGDISFVGPRAHHPGFVDSSADPIVAYTRQRLRPGLIGVSQTEILITGSAWLGNQTASDLAYLTRCSFRYDISMIMHTILVLRQDGAY